jgi:hypothetical protein
MNIPVWNIMVLIKNLKYVCVCQGNWDISMYCWRWYGNIRDWYIKQVNNHKQIVAIRFMVNEMTIRQWNNAIYRYGRSISSRSVLICLIFFHFARINCQNLDWKPCFAEWQIFDIAKMKIYDETDLCDKIKPVWVNMVVMVE